MTTPTIELKPSAHPLSDSERAAILANPGFGRSGRRHKDPNPRHGSTAKRAVSGCVEGEALPHRW